MSSVEERVKKIVVEQLGVKEDELKNDASFVDDLGALTTFSCKFLLGGGFFIIRNVLYSLC